MAIEMVPFSEAADRLSKLLSDCGIGGEIEWVFREDLVAGPKGRIYVRVPVPSENRLLAETEYTRGVRLGFGAELATLCLLGGGPCCYVWVPKDAEDAEYALLVGLKLSVPTPPPNALPLEGSLVERVTFALGGERRDWWTERVPFKGRVTASEG